MIAHILRRMGFGAASAEIVLYDGLSPPAAVDHLLEYERQPDDVDEKIGQAAYAGITTRGQPFSPNTAIQDARQRWLFRMIHTRRPLEEKMALFWHNYFATAYSKIAGALGAVHGAKMMAGKPSELPGRQRGQIELFREYAVGNFRDLLVEVAKDPAMLVWLDGRQNTRQRPQENFARELMELFTIGVERFTEADVHAAARVFTGWNLRLVGDRNDPVASYYEFVFNASQHDTDAKTFSFAIYPDGGRTIPARASSQGMQDGLDLIDALARSPLTADRLARRLYAFFVSDTQPPDEGLVRDVAATYLGSRFSIKATLRRLLQSPQFLGGSDFARYAWPVEFVVRAIKETGWAGLSVEQALTPLVNMGQQLFEPPDVNGWATGSGWFSTASMLARMNFAATLMGNQRFNLVAAARPFRESPERLLDGFLGRYTPAPLTADVYGGLLEYLRDGGSWTGSDAQLNAKAPGLARLIVASAQYQFV